MIFPTDTDPRLPSQAKRALVGERRRRQLQMLQGDIGSLSSKYPELSSVIVAIVSDLQRQAERTRTGDRDAVLRALEAWDATGASVEEISEETGLAPAAVRKVLDELSGTTPALVGYTERGGDVGRPLRIYSLTHTLP